jgi:hypothetical protein
MLAESLKLATNSSLWTYVHSSAEPDVLHAWADSERLPSHVRALIDQKLRVLQQQPLELVRHTHLLSGPVGKHIYKLRVNGTVAVRLMLCRGPRAGEAGYTILACALERDRQLVPRDVIERAERHRDRVLEDPDGKRRPYEALGRRPTN